MMPMADQDIEIENLEAMLDDIEAGEPAAIVDEAGVLADVLTVALDALEEETVPDST